MDGWNFRGTGGKKKERSEAILPPPPPLLRFNHLEIYIVKDVTFIIFEHIFFRTN